MPKIPLAVVSTSSDDSEMSYSDPVGAFKGANWAVMNIDSFDSLPFSEVSHSPYGVDSNFLDSVSRVGSAGYRPSPSVASALDRQDTVMTPLKPGMLSPLPGISRGFRLHGNDQSISTTEVSGAMVAGLPAVPTHFTPKGSDALALHPRLCGAGGAPGAASAAEVARNRKKKQKPPPHRTRSLQIEAAKWLEDDCSTEALVLREVSQRRPVSPMTDAEADDVLSLSSSGATGLLTLPIQGMAPPSSIATGLETAVTKQTALPTAAPKVNKEVTRGPPTNRTEGERAPPVAASSANDPAPFMAAPATTGDRRPVGQRGATANSPLRRAARVNMVPTRRIAPLDGKKGPETDVRRDSAAAATVRRQPETQQSQSPGTTLPTDMPSLIRAGTLSPSKRNAKAATITDATPPSSAANGFAQAPPAAMAERWQAAKGQLHESRQAASGQRSNTYVEAPTAGAHGADDINGEPTSLPDSRPTVLSLDTIAMLSTRARKTTALPLQQPSLDRSTKQRTRPRRTSFASTAIPETISEASCVAGETAEKEAPHASPGRRRRHHSVESLEMSATKAAITESSSNLAAASVVPEERPETRQYGLTDSLHISPANRMAAEKLVAFVQAVSDPEVLHVIYDYLEEHEKAVPRYCLATKACRELLERKEEMLMACLSTSGGAHESSQHSAVGARRPRSVSVPQLVDSPDKKAETARAGEGLTEAQRLLQQIEETDGCDKGDDDDADMDEFDDLNYFPAPYTPSSRFNFGQPSVSGLVTRVFSEGMLYKIKTPKGEYHFYNDTLQEVMVVRVQCHLRGNEKINERAMLSPVASTGETEITIAVLPEETNFFMSGVAHMPHFMAKRVPVPRDYVSPSVTQSLRKINAEINAVRKALGKWSRASDQQAYLKCCLKNNLRFTDLNFRPSSESLYRPEFDAVVIPAVTWRRPEEYIYLAEVSQTRLFRGEISCFLVKQGDLSNHTVVAAMAAVAQFPAHVRWMFRHPVSAHVGKMERSQGCYRVTLLHNGWWHTYLVDDYVPASLRGPLFASCAEDPRRLWVQLLEKAYAKSLGSYAATCLVDAMEALGDFTGFPVRFLDSMWAAAAQGPRDGAFRSLFRYLELCVRAGCTVLLFSPPPTDEQSSATVDMSRKRSSRIMPVKGAVPQFLPGHIYFLRDVAFYEALDLRMVQLKNPWTWETKNKIHYEKKWRYTTWYDQPDPSLSAIASATTSLHGQVCSRVLASHALSPRACTDLSPEAVALNERKGTMWVEWGEALTAFAGGGVCYTMWDRHRYRVRNAFVEGRPRLALELKARRKVELLVTLSLETVSETLDNFGTVVAARPIPLHGTALAVVHRQANQSAKVVRESCDDIESVTGCRTYVVARDVSIKVVVEPSTSSNGAAVLVVPLLDPSAVSAAAVGAGSGSSSSAASIAAAPEVRFVVSIVSDAVAGDGEDLSVHFVSLRRSCGVFTDSTTAFPLEGASRVTAQYQVCTKAGVATCEGSRISGNETKGM
ncbi:calpain-like protein [Leishmania donovani]|nr:calpain-like protein [Leishmania donovani]